MCAARSTKSALITKVRRPKVRIFIGRVRRRRIGLRMLLITPKATAVISAVRILAICTPGKTYAVTRIAKVETNQDNKISI